MKSLRLLLCAALALACLPMVTSCKSDDESTVSYSHKLRQRNEKYEERQEKRKMKLRARQERVDMWYESLMN